MTELHPMLFQNPGLPNGDTVLHQYVKTFESMADFNKLVTELGEEIAAFMATMTNDHGLLPIDVMQECVPIWYDEYNELYDKLLELMTPKNYRDLQVAMDQPPPEEVGQATDELQVNQDMKIAIEIANIVRSRISGSYTHPQTNSFAYHQHLQIEYDIKKMRRIVDGSDKGRSIDNIYHHAVKTSLGNCSEFAMSAFYLLSKKYPQLNTEVVEYANGDHAFVLINRQLGSYIQRPETWGAAAIICDAWMGEVFPATEIQYKLKNYSRYPRSGDHRMINTLLTYNPRYHQFQVVEQHKMRANKVKSHTNQFGLFDHEDKKRHVDKVSKAHSSKRLKK